MKFTWYRETTVGLTKVREQVGNAGRFFTPPTEAAGDFYYRCEATMLTSADDKGYAWEHPTDLNDQVLITVGGTPVANLGEPTIDVEPVSAASHQGDKTTPLSISTTATDDHEYTCDLAYQ